MGIYVFDSKTDQIVFKRECKRIDVSSTQYDKEDNVYQVCSKQYGLERIHLGLHQNKAYSFIEFNQVGQTHNGLIVKDNSTNNLHNNQQDMNINLNNKFKLNQDVNAFKKLSNNHSYSSYLNTQNVLYSDIKNVNSMELDRENNKMILTKNNSICEYFISTNSEMQYFEQLKVKD